MRKSEDKLDSRSNCVKIHVLKTVAIYHGLKTKRATSVSVIVTFESPAAVSELKILYRLIMDKQR